MTEGRKKTGIRYRAALWFVIYFLYFLFQRELPEVLAAPAPSGRQEFLAVEYRFKISRTAGAAEREGLYLRMIDECPETELAEESYWALSNLYLDDFDEPKEDKAREILELFLKRYPGSRWAAHAENRLRWLRGETAKLP